MRFFRLYLILLPVGLAVPPTLLPTRCALTAPFHPYSVERYIFCGAFPEVSLAGSYPAPCSHGARTFLRLRGDHPTVWHPQLCQIRRCASRFPCPGNEFPQDSMALDIHVSIDSPWTIMALECGCDDIQRDIGVITEMFEVMLKGICSPQIRP